MKRMFFKALVVISLLGGGVSCDFFELDNFDGPNSQIYGAFYDRETNKLVEQDMLNGTKVWFTELGWDNPMDQNMTCKVDGTYRNNIFFAGHYNFKFVDKNFAIYDPMMNVEIKAGENRVDFYVTPYIRLRNVDIKELGDGRSVKATFEIQTPDPTTQVKQIGLFAHTDYNVSSQIHLNGNGNDCFKGLSNLVIGDKNAWHACEITIDLRRIAQYSTYFKTGRPYYFRVGALANGNSTVKYNYAPAQQITLESLK